MLRMLRFREEPRSGTWGSWPNLWLSHSNMAVCKCISACPLRVLKCAPCSGPACQDSGCFGVGHGPRAEKALWEGFKAEQAKSAKGRNWSPLGRSKNQKLLPQALLLSPSVELAKSDPVPKTPIDPWYSLLEPFGPQVHSLLY